MIFLSSQGGLRAANAVDVTIEAGDTTLTLGQSTTITVYGRVGSAVAANSLQIFSWYIDVLSTNAGALGGYNNVLTPASDNFPDTSGDGTPQAANLRGIYDTLLFTPGAGMASRVPLVQFEVTALAAGSVTFSVAAGTTVGGLSSDFLVLPTAGEPFTGGNYAGASVGITVSGAVELDISDLDLDVAVSGGQCEVSFNPVPGFNHTVQFSDTLLAPSWMNLPGAPHNSGVVIQTITGVPTRFYRVVVTGP